MTLKRNITKTNLLFLSIGSIVGSGWLFGSFYTAQIAGPASIISWALGGIFVSIIALTFAELSTMLPISGGSITYTLMSHGKMSGSMFSWITWLWSMVVAPIEVQAVLQYSSNYISNLTTRVGTSDTLTAKGLILATVLMMALCVVNVIGVKIMAETNKFVAIWKLIIPIGVAVLLFSGHIHTSNLTSAGGFSPYGFSGILSGIAIGGVSFSFFGFQTPIFLAGEARNPQKSIPIALFGSLFFCLLLYAALQLGFILALNPSTLASGWHNISFVGDAGPFAGIFISLGFIFIVKFLYFDAIISPLGTAVGYTASASRILYSMSLQGDAPKCLTKINVFSIPWLAITANFIMGMLFFLPFSGWQSMVAFLSAAIVVSLACGPICLPIFRKHFPNTRRPFLLPYSTLISFLAFYICNLMLQWTGWNTVWKLDIAIILGLVIIFGSHLFYKTDKIQSLHLKNFVWFVLYMSFSSLLSYLSTFGGGIGLISMQMDFAVVGISSIIVFIVAQKTALSKEESNKIYMAIMQGHRQIPEGEETNAPITTCPAQGHL